MPRRVRKTRSSALRVQRGRKIPLLQRLGQAMGGPVGNRLGLRNKGALGAHPRNKTRKRTPQKLAATVGTQIRLNAAPVATGVSLANRARRPDTIIEDEEFLTDLGVSGGGFVNAMSQPLNAGNANLFPKLSTVAQQYERYFFERLRVSWIPSSATTMAGFVAQQFDYDVSDTAVSSLQQLMENQGATCSTLWTPNQLVLDPRLSLSKHYFVTNSVVLNDASARLNHQALWALFFDNIASPYNTSLGAVKLSYRVRLSGVKPTNPLALRSQLFDSTGASNFTVQATVGGVNLYPGYLQPVVAVGYRRRLPDAYISGASYQANQLWPAFTLPRNNILEGMVTVTWGINGGSVSGWTLNVILEENGSDTSPSSQQIIATAALSAEAVSAAFRFTSAAAIQFGRLYFNITGGSSAVNVQITDSHFTMVNYPFQLGCGIPMLQLLPAESSTDEKTENHQSAARLVLKPVAASPLDILSLSERLTRLESAREPWAAVEPPSPSPSSAATRGTRTVRVGK